MTTSDPSELEPRTSRDLIDRFHGASPMRRVLIAAGTIVGIVVLSVAGSAALGDNDSPGPIGPWDQYDHSPGTGDD